MRSKFHPITSLAFAACLALAGNLCAQSATNFRLNQPIEATNQDGQKIRLIGMQGDSVIFQFGGTGMGNAEASIPVDPNSRIRFAYTYPQNFSDIQLNVLSGNYDRALRLIRNPPVDLLRFLSIPEANCNFHLYAELYYRALVFAGDAEPAVQATEAIPFGSQYLPAVFKQHAGFLLNRLVSEKQVSLTERLLTLLKQQLPVKEFSTLALPVADQLRLLGENQMVERIYQALSESSEAETRQLGQLWIAYNKANSGNTRQAKAMLDKIGELNEENPLFAVYCLAQGRLALAEKNSTQALRYLSRAMVRTSISDSYKPEIYFLMIQSYILDNNMVPARRLTREMAVFYPTNMWLETIKSQFPQLEESKQITL